MKFRYFFQITSILCVILLTLSCGPADHKMLEIKGIVVSKFKRNAENCLGAIIVKNGSRLDTLKSICTCVPPREQVWDYVIAGDSVIKESGSLTLDVMRAGKRKSFRYPSCYL
jgi:hypothetical protein